MTGSGFDPGPVVGQDRREWWDNTLHTRTLRSRWSGDNKINSLCPAHDDNNPSLTSEFLGDGRIRVKCWAGCTEDEICAALGVRPADLAPKGTKARRRPTKQGGSPAAVETETAPPEPLPSDAELADASERLRAAVELRTRLMRERQWSPAVIGNYGLGLGSDGAIWIPIRAVDETLVQLERYWPFDRERKIKVLALANRPRELLFMPDDVPAEIYVFEGFADALAAASHDIPAIGAPSASWQDRWAEQLTAAGVETAHVVGDCDDPGRKFIAAAVANLTRVGIEARPIDLDPSRSDKYDATDLFVEHGPDAARKLAQLVDETPSQTAVLSVDASRLLDETTAYLRRRIWLPREEQYWALALWIAHTHAIKAANGTPYIEINSPQKGCGKTLALEVLALLVRKPWHTNSTSEAALFRKIEADMPTLLLDEIDAVFASASERTEPLRAILNSGNRPGVTVTRCVGREHEVAEFSVFCAKALAGIDTGRLPDTIRDRSITIRMQRLGPAETIERATGVRRRKLEEIAEKIRFQWEAWGERVTELLRAIEPDDIDALSPRAFDGWEPMLSIAQFAGDKWPARANRAALALSSGEAVEDESNAVVLLRVIRRIFGDRGVVASDELCTRINGDDTLRFGGWNDGNGINARDLARQLKPYGIKPRTVRIGDTTPKGYSRNQLADAWARYLNPPHIDPNPPHENPRDMGDVADVADVADIANNGSNGHSQRPIDITHFQRSRIKDSAA